MITIVKQSKLDKVNPNLFLICSVSKSEDFGEDANDYCIFLPTDDIYRAREDGSMSKKKFAKKYRSYLETKRTAVEFDLYLIAQAVKSKNNICFTCTDDEYQMGYLDILAEVLGEMYGIEYVDYKEVKDNIRSQLDELSKKERKLIDEDPSDLSDKKAKIRKNIIKEIRKSVHAELSTEGEERLEKQSHRFAIDGFVIKLMGGDNPAIEFKSDGTPKFHFENYEGKGSDIINVILSVKEDDKTADVIKDVLASYKLKLKKDSLKQLTTDQLLPVLAECYQALVKIRYRIPDDD